MSSGSLVGYQPWAGDRPTIYFSPHPKTSVVFVGSAKRTWTLYHTLRVSRADMRKHGDEFNETLPEWAFVLTNGADQISLTRNVGEPVFAWHTRASGTAMSVDISERDARRMFAELWEFKGHHIPSPRSKKDARIRPIGSAVTYVGIASVFHAKP